MSSVSMLQSLLEAVSDFHGDGLDWYVHYPLLHYDAMSPSTLKIFQSKNGINFRRFG